MKFIKTYEESDDNKRMGIYVSIAGILEAIKFLKDRNIRFMLLFGKDEDDGGDEEYYLVVIEGNDYKKLPYEETDTCHYDYKERFKDYYMPCEDLDKVFLNWFDQDDINHDWKIIPHETKKDLEEIEMISNINKYNL